MVSLKLNAGKGGPFEESIRIRTFATMFDLNASLALVASFLIRGDAMKGVDLPLLEVLPGRFEITRFDPPLVLDSAQSPEAIGHVISDWKRVFGRNAMPQVILGLGKDKDLEGILGVLKRNGIREILAVKPDSLWGREPADIIGQAIANGFRAKEIGGGPLGAYHYIRTTGTPCLVTGSLYLVGAIHRLGMGL